MDINTKEKFLAAHKLLFSETTTIEKFESVKSLIKGIDPKVDQALRTCSKVISTLEKLQKGDIIELSSENLPENTQEEKKRKRTLLWLIRSWKQLQSEVERVKSELESPQISSFAKIIAQAKGPFGLITIAALMLILAYTLINKPESQKPEVASVRTEQPVSVQSPSQNPMLKSKVRVIIFNGKKISLDQLEVRSGPDCTNSPREVPHYHAKNGKSAKTLDKDIIADPGACGFGKVDNTPIVELEL